MGLTMAEQETVIKWDRASDKMNLYTADSFLIERLRGNGSYKLVREYKQGGQVVAADFEADKKLITIRKGRRTVSEAQKAQFRANIAKCRQRDSEEIDSGAN